MNKDLEKLFDKEFGVANGDSARFILRNGHKEVFIDNTAIKSFIDKHFIEKEDAKQLKYAEPILYTPKEVLDIIGEDREVELLTDESKIVKSIMYSESKGYNQAKAEIRKKL